MSTMLARVSAALRTCLSIEQFSQISISCHLFPEDWDRRYFAAPQAILRSTPIWWGRIAPEKFPPW